MQKRTLLFGNPYHISTRYKQLVISDKEQDADKQVPIEDIGIAIFDNSRITFTQSAIQELTENNVAVIFCNAQHHPASMLLHLDTHYIQNEKFRNQLSATEPLQKNIWKQLIVAKINNQAAVLKHCNKKYQDIQVLAKNVKSGDTNNVEGTAARMYWQRLFISVNKSEQIPKFGLAQFVRSRDGMPPNTLLNYGYAIIRAAVARAIAAAGLLPTLGVHHHNKYNAYCLADDVMEPYRPFTDWCVANIMHQTHNYHVLSKEIKTKLISVLHTPVICKNEQKQLQQAISDTAFSLAKCFDGKQKKLAIPDFGINKPDLDI